MSYLQIHTLPSLLFIDSFGLSIIRLVHHHHQQRRQFLELELLHDIGGRILHPEEVQSLLESFIVGKHPIGQGNILLVEKDSHESAFTQGDGSQLLHLDGARQRNSEIFNQAGDLIVYIPKIVIGVEDSLLQFLLGQRFGVVDDGRSVFDTHLACQLRALEIIEHPLEAILTLLPFGMGSTVSRRDMNEDVPLVVQDLLFEIFRRQLFD